MLLEITPLKGSMCVKAKFIFAQNANLPLWFLPTVCKMRIDPRDFEAGLDWHISQVLVQTPYLLPVFSGDKQRLVLSREQGFLVEPGETLLMAVCVDQPVCEGHI